MDAITETSPEPQLKKEHPIVDRLIESVKEKNLSDFGRKTGERDWKDHKVNINDIVINTDGPLIEIGGPTEGGYELIDVDALPKKLIVSNISNNAPIYDSAGELIEYYGRVDFLADGKNMPIKDDSAAGVFMSGIPTKNDDKSFIKEAHRVLKNKGLLLIQGMGEINLDYIQQLGFNPLLIRVFLYFPGEFKKPFFLSGNISDIIGIFQKTDKNDYSNEATNWEKIIQESKETRRKLFMPKYDIKDGHLLNDAERINGLGEKCGLPLFYKLSVQTDWHDLTAHEAFQYIASKNDIVE